MEFLKSLLSEETLKTLTDALGEDLIKTINEKTTEFKIDVAKEKFIPKNKFDEVNNLVKDYKTQIEDRDKQLKELASKANGNEELTKKIAELQTANDLTKAEYEAKILAREKDFAIDTELVSKYKVRNAKAVKALIADGLDKVEFKEGKLSGLDELITPFKESDSYLFDVDKSKDAGGLPPGKTKTTTDEFADFRKLV